jgi:hypothetical protein
MIDGPVDEGAGDRDALALAAGELVRPVVDPVSQAHALEGLRARSWRSCGGTPA